MDVFRLSCRALISPEQGKAVNFVSQDTHILIIESNVVYPQSLISVTEMQVRAGSAGTEEGEMEWEEKPVGLLKALALDHALLLAPELHE